MAFSLPVRLQWAPISLAPGLVNLHRTFLVIDPVEIPAAHAGSVRLRHAARRGFPARRTLAGHALAAALALLIALVLARLRGQLSPAAEVLCLLLAVIAVALAGGLIPAVIEAVAGSLLLRFLVTAPGKPALAGASGVTVLGILVGAAVVVSLLTEDATRHIRQAARAAKADRLMTEADRMRTALLTAISQELRPPLASADAALSCLRCPAPAPGHRPRTCDRLAHLGDGPDRLMAQNPPLGHRRDIALENMQVGAADRRGVDPHHHVSRLLDHGIGDLFPGLLPGPVVHQRLHRYLQRLTRGQPRQRPPQGRS